MGPLPTSWDPSLDGSEAKTSLLPDDMLMALARASGYAPVKVVACGGFGCQRTVLIQHEAVEATELAASTIIR